MNNKDILTYPGEDFEATDRRDNAQRRQDLKDFTKAAMQGLCTNQATIEPEYLAKAAVVIAVAALAELERRNDASLPR